MTTRIVPPERPPSVRSIPRTQSSAHSIHRPPPPHRSLSQQHTSSSPTRRTTNEGFGDVDGHDGFTRAAPRSKLNLEIGKNSQSEYGGESPKPFLDSASPWKSALPPRGRPLLHSDVPSVTNFTPRTPQDRGQNEPAIKPMPLPVRPGQHAPPTTTERPRQGVPNSAKKDARPKPYSLEVPTAAPRYFPDGYADFYPWTGKHAEDQFSDSVIRLGYSDKTQMTLNETGSARQSVFPQLKHKSGLNTLSSLFTSVLAQRRAHGQVTIPSTFKPPPRVTVTDTKREMWLKDLANPTIPLRRLSRSIPHGIRGKVLLDQSLSKNIPIERAVWLAKCVGANELRSFRRKGANGAFVMGGEAKWIRDFTICVEQFVESSVGCCGEDDFKIKINYVLRLATHFYSEYLLDREHYMEWLVLSLENSPQAKLPMWLLITQIYWKDLLQYRKYGRRLSTAILNHLAEAVNHPDKDILAPLSTRLNQLFGRLILSSPDNFLLPNTWSKYERILVAHFESQDEPLRSALSRLNRRNKNLSSISKEEKLSPKKRLVTLLDGTLSRTFSTVIPLRCWEVDGDKLRLMRTLLDWATSIHRPGHEKIYAAARILRSWKRFGADPTDAILKYIDAGYSDRESSKISLYHLVSELARSEHFSVARYLEWLIARGGLYNASDVAKDGPCATRLLAEIPTHNLSGNITELRTTLLSRVEFEVEIEDAQVDDYMAGMNRSLLGMQRDTEMELDPHAHPIEWDVLSSISKTSRTIKSEIGLWLRAKVREQMTQLASPALENWDNSPSKLQVSAISVADFSTVRSYLCVIEDYSMLADVLKIVSSSNNPEVLASCADAVNLYLGVFAAIGAVKSLFDLLLNRKRSFTEELCYVPRVFLVALSNLASRLPEHQVIAEQLSSELAQSDRKTAADACSPVSDHMALIQSAETDFTDEIEKILASGNSMDKATLERLFQRIAVRLEESFEKSPEQQRSCVLLFTRLKTFDSEQFSVLMNAWVTRFLQFKGRPSIVQVLGPLISFGCLSLLEVVSNVNALCANDQSSLASQEALSLILASQTVPDAMSTEEACRLRIKQAHMQQDNPREVLSVIRQAVQRLEDPHAASGALADDALHELLQRLTLLDTDLATKELFLPLLQSPVSALAITSAIDRLLLGHSPTSAVSSEHVLGLVDNLTLPFCQVKLAAIFNTNDNSMRGVESGTTDQLEAFDKAIESAVTAGRTSWTSIVPLLDSSIAQHLRHRAESRFLASFPSPKSNDATHNQLNLTDATNFLHIVEATSYTLLETSPSIRPGTALEVALTLNNLWILVSTTQSQIAKLSILSTWLPMLLTFITIQRQTFDSAKTGHEYRAKTILGLAAIFLELESLDTGMDTVGQISSRVYDLALFLVDSLPEDLRQQCVKRVQDTTSHPRVRYLFSFASNPSEWLVMSQREKFSTSNSSDTKDKEKMVPYPLKRWEMLGESTPNIGENDTSLPLTFFGARRG